MTEGVYRSSEYKELMNPEVVADIEKAAKAWAFLDAIGPTALLGGAVLSWTSGIAARDWDFYMSRSCSDALNVEGWKFTSKISKKYGDDYSGKTTHSGWRIADNKLMGSEQIILVPEKIEDRNAIGQSWMTFDYGHCMVGITPDLNAVLVGLQIICDGKLVQNPKSPIHRSHKEVLKKLKDKSAFGGGEPVKEAFSAVCLRFIEAANKYKNSESNYKGYEEFRKALKL